MVALVGVDAVKPSDFASFNPHLSQEAQVINQPMWFFEGVYYDAANAVNHAPLSRDGFNQVVPAQRALNGFVLEDYFDDFYYRIHINPSRIDVGNLAANETYTVNVWNSYLSPKTLTEITEGNAGGINWVGPVPPATFMALQEVNYQFTISRIGPSVINASFVFDFMNANDPILVITGSRVVLFPYKPLNGFKERLEWKTDVMQAYLGEQRIALRMAARTTYSYDYKVTPREFSMIKLLTAGWGARSYAVPVWMEGSDVSVALDATQVLFDTRFASFRPNSTVAIFADDGRSEVVTIESVLPDRVTFDRPFPSDISGRIYPVRFARLLGGIDFTREPKLTAMSAVFSVEDNAPVVEELGMVEYKGLPVVLDCQVLRSPIPEKIFQSVTLFDNGSGPVEVEDSLGYISKLRTISQLRINREQRWQLRAFLNQLKGKQGVFWLPTFNADLEIAAPINSGQASIIVRAVNFGLYSGEGDILIRLVDGSMLLRRVTGVLGVPEGEQISTDEVFSSTVLPFEIDKIMFLEKVRLDSDTIELNYPALQYAEFSAPVREVPE